jgi:phosphoketolase
MGIMSSRSRTLQAHRPDTDIFAYGVARSTVEGRPLGPDELSKINAYWRASLYLSLGMLYLKANPLLREPLALEHIKPRLLGHWGSDAGAYPWLIHRLTYRPHQRHIHVRGYKEKGNIMARRLV